MWKLSKESLPSTTPPLLLLASVSLLFLNTLPPCSDAFTPNQYFRSPPIEKETNLEKINAYFENLYLRLQKKDYELAQFGEPCELVRPEDLENFLEMAYQIVRDQEEDGTYRRAVEQHLRPKLRHFFDRSISFCDFRRLLTCDKKSKTCVCPHSSMGVGRNGSCQVNIGKRCDFSGDKLSSLGILIVEGVTQKVSCIGGAECVTSFGAANKICKCPSGFWGSDCKASVYNTQSRGEFAGVGSIKRDAAVWGGSQGFNDDPQYYLYPEEIQEELVKIMNLRGLYEPAEREKAAERLEDKIASDLDAEEIVTQDIYLRRASNLSYGEPCDPQKQVIVDNPPIAKKETELIEPDPEVIKSWQGSLLKDGKAMCNFVNYMVCDGAKRVCQCAKGTTWHANECQVALSQPCGPDFNGAFQLNALKEQKQFMPPISPGCITGAECTIKPMYFLKRCWCPVGSTCPPSKVGEMGRVFTKKDTLQKEILERFSLNFGEACDPKTQQVVISPPETNQDSESFDKRILAMRALMKVKPPVQLCNIDNYLNCSDVSRTCTCWNDLVQESGDCRVTNLVTCDANYPIGNDFYPGGGTKIWKLEAAFVKKFLPQCIKDAKCGSEGDEEPGKCLCKNGMAGETCTGPRSVFCSVLRTRNVHGFYKDSEINKVFHKLHYYTSKMETLMVLMYNDKCDPAVGLMMNRIVMFYRMVASSDANISGKFTLHRYMKVSKWIQHLLNTGYLGLCNAFLGLKCHRMTEKCRCPKDSVYEDKICKLKVKEECDDAPKASWVPTCRTNSECIPAMYNFKFQCSCKEGFGGDSCSDVVIVSSKNQTAVGCQKGGTSAECREDDVEEGRKRNPPRVRTIDSPVDPDFFDEFDEMLREIVEHRALPLDARCEPHNEAELHRLFPTLPRYSRHQYNKTLNPRNVYSKLRWIYNAGIMYCDRRKYLYCESANEKCQCGESYGLVQEGKRCALMEFSICGDIGTAYDKKLMPNLICQKGTKCTKLDYALHKCIRTARSNERF